jgi:hypothetical protein
VSAFIAGTSVKGGFYGDEPSLTDLDLKPTTDFPRGRRRPRTGSMSRPT